MAAIAVVDAQLQQVSKKGYRTMMLAYKKIPLKQWTTFAEKYAQAKETVEGSDLVAKLQSDMERGLWLLGGVSLEDKLHQQNNRLEIKIIKLGAPIRP